MSLRKRVQSLKDKKSEEDYYDNLSYILCKTFHWDYETLMKQPIPFINSLVDSLIKEHKEQDKMLKKAKKGK